MGKFIGLFNADSILQQVGDFKGADGRDSTFEGIDIGKLEELSLHKSDLRIINIPEGVEVIASQALSGFADVKIVNLPSSLRVIEKSAFESCGIYEITIPKNVDFMYAKAFRNCFNLREAKFEMFSLNFIPSFYFSNCRSLKTVELPKLVEDINQGAFYDCQSLEKIILPTNLQSIGDYAFYNTKSLKELTVPKSVVYIGNQAFDGSGIKRLKIENSKQFCDQNFSETWVYNFEGEIVYLDDNEN